MQNLFRITRIFVPKGLPVSMLLGINIVYVHPVALHPEIIQ